MFILSNWCQQTKYSIVYQPIKNYLVYYTIPLLLPLKHYTEILTIPLLPQIKRYLVYHPSHCCHHSKIIWCINHPTAATKTKQKVNHPSGHPTAATNQKLYNISSIPRLPPIKNFMVYHPYLLLPIKIISSTPLLPPFKNHMVYQPSHGRHK